MVWYFIPCDHKKCFLAKCIMNNLNHAQARSQREAATWVFWVQRIKTDSNGREWHDIRWLCSEGAEWIGKKVPFIVLFSFCPGLIKEAHLHSIQYLQTLSVHFALYIFFHQSHFHETQLLKNGCLDSLLVCWNYRYENLC